MSLAGVAALAGVDVAVRLAPRPPSLGAADFVLVAGVEEAKEVRLFFTVDRADGVFFVRVVSNLAPFSFLAVVAEAGFLVVVVAVGGFLVVLAAPADAGFLAAAGSVFLAPVLLAVFTGPLRGDFLLSAVSVGGMGAGRPSGAPHAMDQ